MLFISHLELNENMPQEERQRIAQNIISSGAFPPPGVNIIRWDSTADLWGTLLFEAESAEDVLRTIAPWRTQGGGFFKSIRTAPALPVQEIIPLIDETSQKLANS